MAPTRIFAAGLIPVIAMLGPLGAPDAHAVLERELTRANHAIQSGLEEELVRGEPREPG